MAAHEICLGRPSLGRPNPWSAVANPPLARRRHMCLKRGRLRANSSALSIAADDGRREQHYQRDVLQKMLTFMGPAVLIPMADPLMAVVDTIFVGQFAGTMELAAMGPANMLLNFALYIFQGLQVATLSLVAKQLRDKDDTEAAQLLSCGLMMAAVLGSIGGCLLGFNSEALIQATGVKDQALVPYSSQYLGIRALALPAVVVTAVAQSGKLAQQDSVTPCLSVMLSVAFSFIANIVVVAGLGWGLVGAAITTVATQYLGAVALLYALHHPSSELKPDWRIPRPDQMWTFLTTMAPMTIVSLSKNTCYLIVQTTAATLPTLSLAAHQAAFSLWAFFTWLMSPVEQACMAYLPAAKERWQIKSTAQLVVFLGTVLALAAGLTLASLFVWGPGLLVKNQALHPLMSSIVPQAVTSLILVGIDVAATSINIALRDYQYVARSYVFTLMATVGYFVVCRSLGWGLPGVWWGLFVFFGSRCVQSVGRMLFTWEQRTGEAGESTGVPKGDGKEEGSLERVSGGQGRGGEKGEGLEGREGRRVGDGNGNGAGYGGGAGGGGGDGIGMVSGQQAVNTNGVQGDGAVQSIGQQGLQDGEVHGDTHGYHTHSNGNRSAISGQGLRPELAQSKHEINGQG